MFVHPRIHVFNNENGYPNCPDFGYPVPKIFENAQPCLLTNVKDL